MSILSEFQTATTNTGKTTGKRNQMAFQLLLRLELIYLGVAMWGIVKTEVLRGGTTQSGKHGLWSQSDLG